MNVGGIFLGIFCVTVAALVSVHIFFDPEPEFQSVTSADGALVITGSVYESQSFSLREEAHEVAFAPLSSSRYFLLPDDALFVQPLVAKLSQHSEDTLYFIDSVAGYAIPLEREMNALGESFFLLTRGGEYALGEELRVEAPTFVDVVTQMRSRLSEHVVAYRVRTVVTPKDGTAVLLGAVLEEGGCGGVPFASEQTVVAEDQRTVQVLVNDVLTETTFTFRMEIGTTSSGCPEDMPLRVIL